MLTLSDCFWDRGHKQVSRRQFLRVGGLGLGGLGLTDLLAARAAASALGRPLKDKAVVFVFMHGGPPQTETFDPKMTAPLGVRSVTGEVRTTLPGVTFGGTLAKLARRAHRMAIVRSFRTGDQKHDLKPIVGKTSLGANLGSLYARVAGTTRAGTGMPTNVALFPRAVDPKAQGANLNFGKFGATGPLGLAYAPFEPGSGGELQQDMQLRIAQGRLEDRRELLARMDDLRRRIETDAVVKGLSRFQEQAFDTILGGAAKAFDLSGEDPRVIERYDTAPLVPQRTIDRRWNNYQNYVDNARTLGKLMLMARRLCEAGCGFVTVTTNFVWDMHADVNNATIEEGMRYCGLPFDHAIATFLDDVHERGLSEKILLVCCGEMGRTPRLNRRGGRDHWGDLAPLMLAGGGLKMGQVIGQSSRDASEPASSAVTIRDLMATIMHTLLDPGEVRTLRGLPSEVVRTITGGQPIGELM